MDPLSFLHVESIVLVVSAWEIGQGKQKRSGTVRDPLPEGPGPNRCGLQHRPQRCGRLTLKHRDEELKQPRLGEGLTGLFHRVTGALPYYKLLTTHEHYPNSDIS